MLARVTERARQQAVSAHGEHHAGQAEQQHHDHGGQADHNAKTDDFGGQSAPTISNAVASDGSFCLARSL